MTRVGAFLTAMWLAGSALAAPVTSDTPSTTAAGTGFTVPAAFDLARSGAVNRLVPPEGDSSIAIVDVGTAADARAAVTAAWAAYGKPEPKVLQVTPRSAKTGWDERAVVDYDTPPDAKAAVQAIAFRRGSAWTVALLDAAQATAEKRGAALGLLLSSLRPAGYTRENFAGKPHEKLDAAKVEVLKAFVADNMKKLGVPGVGLAFIQDNRILFEGGLGVKTVGKPDPVGPHTSFIIASNTKSMATMLLAKLADDGKLAWDDPVVKLYPSFRLGNDATTAATQVRHLVCACTGLPRKDLQWLFATSPSTPASDTFVQLAATQPTSKFGEAFQYSNLMASAAGYVAGHLFYPRLELGAAFDKAVATRIWQPIGMVDSTFSVDAALARDHADPHATGMDGKVVVIPQNLNRSVYPYRPAGGAWSSAHDMIRYVALELNLGRTIDGKRVVSEANLLERRKRGVSAGEDQWYGMGLWEDATWGVPIIHHGGDLSGYHSDMMWIPGTMTGAVILTNGDDGAALRRPLLRRMIELMYGGAPEAQKDIDATAARLVAERATLKDRVTLPPDPAAVAQLAPAYTSNGLGPLKVSRRGDQVDFAFTAFHAPVGTHRNDDGTTSFISVAPELWGVELSTGTRDGKTVLFARDAQHEYVFTPAGR